MFKILNISNIALFITLVSAGCGGSGGGGSDSSSPPDPAFLQIKAIVDSDCGGCHNGSGQRKFNSANFKSSTAAKRIKNNSMPPPPRELSPENKTALLTYLEG